MGGFSLRSCFILLCQYMSAENRVMTPVIQHYSMGWKATSFLSHTRVSTALRGGRAVDGNDFTFALPREAPISQCKVLTFISL